MNRTPFLHRHAATLAAPLALVLCGLAPVAAQAMQLTYEADFIGTPAGRAEVSLDIRDDRYSLVGEARAAGLMRLLTRWHSRFEVQGRLEDGVPVTEHYHFEEADRGKSRVVSLVQGVLNVFKNGKPREPKPAPSLDLISALFVPGNCQVPDEVFNSRYRYRMRLLDAAPASQDGASPAPAMSCAYEVVDDDEDRWTVRLELTRVGEHLVPADMRIDGVAGRVRLAAAVADPVAVAAPALGLAMGNAGGD